MDRALVNRLNELASIGIVFYTGSVYVLTDHAHDAAYTIQAQWRALKS